MKRLLTTALLGTCLLAATSAFAGEGYVTANVSLRAGPDRGYPSVVRLRAGTPVDIDGCVDDWAWCDVSIGDDRGWAPGAYLQEEYNGRRVLVSNYGVRIGLPIISFVFGDYWDNHYRGRSWYGSRDRYSRVHSRYYGGGSYYGHSGGSYDHNGGSYGHSGGSYRHSGGSYSGSHDSTYRNSRDSTTYRNSPRVESRDSQPVQSSGYRSGGSRRSGTVTTQRNYEAQQSIRPSYQTAPSRQVTTRHDVNAGSRMQQTRDDSATVHNANPQRSASGELHSAGGQQRAAEVHQRNADRSQQRGNDKADRGSHKDKKDKDGNGGN